MRSLRHLIRTLGLLCCLLSITAAAAGAAAAATTRFASTGGVAMTSTCTDPAAPCTLLNALEAAQAGDTVSLAAGTYDMGRIRPLLPLRWTATDPQAMPVLTSSMPAPTFSLTAGQSGTSFDHVEIDNTNADPGVVFQPAVELATGVSATISSSVIEGRECVDAPDSGTLVIDLSALSTPISSTCLQLGPSTTLRRSTVSVPANAISRALPPPVLVTDGVVEATSVSGGLSLTAPTAVARRVRATGVEAITGEGLVVDSLATGAGADGAAIAANAPGGGAALTVVNSTAINRTGPALVAREAGSATATASNTLIVTNSIARGQAADIKAELPTVCALGSSCVAGEIQIDHSDFATQDPAAAASPRLGHPAITIGGGDIASDPLFADAANGDYHLLPGSHAIDAGSASEEAAPTDLDGHPRAQGNAPDLGAFETTPPSGNPPPPPPPPPAPPPPPPHAKPVLAKLKFSPGALRLPSSTQKASRSSMSARITFTLSERATVRLSFARAERGRRIGKTCKPSSHGTHNCTLLRTVGSLTVRGAPGGNTVRLPSGRIAGRQLAPGSYTLIATPTDSAHGAGRPQTTGFTVSRRSPHRSR